jgi:hypothetical protein
LWFELFSLWLCLSSISWSSMMILRRSDMVAHFALNLLCAEHKSEPQSKGCSTRGSHPGRHRIHVAADMHRAGGGRLRRAADHFDQAHPTIAGDGQPFVVAEPRHLDPGLFAGLDQRQARIDLDLLVVDDDLAKVRLGRSLSSQLGWPRTNPGPGMDGVPHTRKTSRPAPTSRRAGHESRRRRQAAARRRPLRPCPSGKCRRWPGFRCS